MHQDVIVIYFHGMNNIFELFDLLYEVLLNIIEVEVFALYR